MSVKIIEKRKVRQRKKKHIKKTIYGTADRPRLVVFRSLKHMYAQLVDDTSHKTILTVSSLSKDLKADIKKAKSKVEVAKIVGTNIAKRAKELKYTNVLFDRAGYVYHGRVKALADGAREGGLNF
jgi:large subunit ribosomal protein L18